MSSTGRVIFNFQHGEPSGAKFGEVYQGSWIPRPDLDAATIVALGLRIGASDRLYLCDFANFGLSGTPKMVVFQLGAEKSEDRFVYSYEFPAAVVGKGSMLNDFNLNPDESALFIADTSFLAGVPALIACRVAAMQQGSAKACRRVLEGHASVVPEMVNLNMNPSPMVLQMANTRRITGGSAHLRFGVDSIALDRAGKWLYYGPFSGSVLWRVPADVLLQEGLSAADVESNVEVFSSKPITDGISVDGAGNILLATPEHYAVAKVDAQSRNISVVLRSTEYLQWPDGLGFGPDNWLYVTCSALHHTFLGRNLSELAPFYIMRMKMDVGAMPGQ